MSRLATLSSSTPLGPRFLRLLAASRASGGLMRETEALQRLARHNPCTRPVEAIRFEWSGDHWWPMFQFDAAMALREPVVRVRAELRQVFDGWDMAEWFVQPNSWLEGRCPLDLLETEPADVLRAARADRYVAAG
jgi:hypothetical protein